MRYARSRIFFYDKVSSGSHQVTLLLLKLLTICTDIAISDGLGNASKGTKLLTCRRSRLTGSLGSGATAVELPGSTGVGLTARRLLKHSSILLRRNLRRRGGCSTMLTIPSYRWNRSTCDPLTIRILKLEPFKFGVIAMRIAVR